MHPELPPHLAKAAPSNGWMLFTDGAAAVLVLLGTQFFSANESYRLLSWCCGFRVTHVVTMTEDGAPIWYPRRPRWWTRLRWRWLRRRHPIPQLAVEHTWPAPTRPEACQEALRLLT
jgi:hypothetical protein